MGDQAAPSLAPASPPQCPCCILPASLFLPSNRDDGDGDDDDGADSSSYPATVRVGDGTAETAGSCPRAGEGEGEGEGKGEDGYALALAFALARPHLALEEIMRGFDGGDSSPTSRGEVSADVRMVDTHGHPHLRGERNAAYVEDEDERGGLPDTAASADVVVAKEESFRRHPYHHPAIVSLTCSVVERDWDDALSHASSSPSILPALGVHPWYLHELPEGDGDGWLDRLEALLNLHPSAIVGEIGLCKMARNVRTHPGGKAEALLRQRDAFAAQMRLAARLRRPVSVHCVKQHGVLLSVLEEMKREAEEGGSLPSPTSGGGGGGSSVSPLAGAFPPAIAMHSFTGTAHQVRQILAFEETIFGGDSGGGRRSRSQKKGGSSAVDAATATTTTASPLGGPPPLFYFGFSHSIKFLMCTSAKSRRQGGEAIRAVPRDRVLAESDVHHPADVAAGTAGAVANIAEALGVPLVDAARLTTANGLTFLSAVRDSVCAVPDDE